MTREPESGSARAKPCSGVLDGAEPATGNYFVSTYPPFSCWAESAVEDFGRVLDEATDARRPPLGLYVHIPFCVDRCQYCYYLSYDHQLGEIDAYLDALAREIEMYGERSAVAGRPLEFVYFGGGTPSLLSVPRVQRLFGGLRRVMPWDRAREISFECAPKSVTEAKLRALRASGVTRISLGVQQLDDDVLRANGRVHLVSDVQRAYELIRRVGFDVVNLDLIVGLVGETDDSFGASLESVIGMAPESVTIYQLEIPLNTPLYRALRDGRQSVAPASWDQKRARLRRGIKRLESVRYSMRSAYSAVRDPERHRFIYQDAQYHGADLIGIGASAFSHFSGINHQNLASLGDYHAAVSAGRLPLWRAYALSEDERAVRQLVLQLKLGGADLARFRAEFGMNVLDRFAEPLAELQRAGWVELRGDALAMTREGLLRVDRLLPAFYLPEHRGVRYS